MTNKRAIIAIALLTACTTAYAPPDTEPEDEQRCLANVVYHEARGESLHAQRAVLDTVFHRMIQSRSSACAVITAKAQFSWYKGKMKPYTDEMARLLARAMAIPRVLRNENSRFFFSGEPPYWVVEMECRSIGRLNFCRKISTRK